ncbi:MAG TPA: hypothetical protein VGO00_22135, partial [Kofleriaceae bacterium]|nr:hypothetical protein [Kofleriaceae bacterium]
MPVDAIHLTAMREGLAHAGVSAEARRAVARAEHAARLGAVWLDLPYFASFGANIVRYGLGLTLPHSIWGTETHDRAAPLFRAVIRRGAAVRDELARCEAAAFTIGLASHIAIDRALHPLVNWLAERYRRVSKPNLTMLQAHREVEKFHSLEFHESYWGRDSMGTVALASYMGIDGIDRLDRGHLGMMGRRAMTDAFGTAPSVTDVVAWGRGYALYVRLLASPVAKLLVSRRARDQAAELSHGDWGGFTSHLRRAI